MTDREDKIRERAYSIWEAEGYPHGRAEDHWHRAVHEIVGDPGLQTAAPAAAKKPAPKRRKAATGAPAPVTKAPAAKTKSTATAAAKRTTTKRTPKKS